MKGINKGRWEEGEKYRFIVGKSSGMSWPALSKFVGTRTIKQCRLQWQRMQVNSVKVGYRDQATQWEPLLDPPSVQEELSSNITGGCFNYESVLYCTQDLPK